MSIRSRLALWHSSIFALSLAAFAFIVWAGTRHTLHADIDTWLSRQGDGLERFLRMETHGIGEAAVVEEAREFSTGLPLGSGLEFFDGKGRLLLSRPRIVAENLDESRIPLAPGRDKARSLTRSLTLQGDEYRFLLWRSTEDSEEALNRLALVLVALTPVFLVLSAAGGLWLSRHAFRPVDEITETARSISLGNLSASLPVPAHRDELARLCEAWNEMLGRLDVSAKRLSQFTADASHELRTPVAVIRTTAEMALRHERPPSEYRDALDQVQRVTVAMSQTLDDLLELARSDAGQSRSLMTPVDLQAILLEVHREMLPLATERKQSFILESGSPELRVSGDRDLLRRLLLILLDNAIRFTPSGGRIALRARVSPDGIVMEVEDTGIGIAERDLPFVFDRFYQADRSRAAEGVGLGLAIAHWIVKTHHGVIDVTSVPGRGSTFRVVLGGTA